jgi:hypothetical protein
MDRWLADKAFYQLELTRFAKDADAPPDNPDQRLAEDMNLFTSYSVSLSMGLLNAVVTLVSFVGILWTLSGSFAFSFNGSDYVIPGFMVWMAVVYCVARQRHHALHRAPADRPEFPPAAVRGRLPAPPGAGARIQRVDRAGPGRAGGTAAPGWTLRPAAGQLPATDPRAEAPDLVHGGIRSGGRGVSLSSWRRRVSSAAPSSWAS